MWTFRIYSLRNYQICNTVIPQYLPVMGSRTLTPTNTKIHGRSCPSLKMMWYSQPSVSVGSTLTDMQGWLYSIDHYSHHALYYIPISYLFYNLKCVPFHSLHPFHPPPPPTTDSHQSAFCICNYELVFFLSCLGGGGDSTYKWDHTVFVFLCLTYFT